MDTENHLIFSWDLALGKELGRERSQTSLVTCQRKEFSLQDMTAEVILVSLLRAALFPPISQRPSNL